MHIVPVILMVFVQVWCVDGCKTTVSYSCYKSNSKEEVTLEWCWDIRHLFSCKKTIFKTVNELGTCFRDECCPGYNKEFSCNPLCFGQLTCPNGGSCIRPNYCACADGFAGDKCEDIDECSQLNGGCSHECINNLGSFNCSCPEGFYMATNMHTCIEIRTPPPSPPPGACVLNNGNCSHACVETKDGTRLCDCPKGYEISENGTTCTVIDPTPTVLVVNKDSFVLYIFTYLTLSLTLLALLAMFYLKKRFDWHVRASASMISLFKNVKQMWVERRQFVNPKYERIRTVNEDYEKHASQYSDLKQPLIENEDIICSI